MPYDIASIIFAIHLVAPQLPSYIVNTYATAIERQVEKTTPEISPLTYITIIAHESAFKSNAISQDGFDYGLMQIRAIYYKGPATNLLNAEANIRAGAYILHEDAKACAKILGREPSLEETLSIYTGSIPSCRANKLTKIFVDYQVCLEDEIERGVEKNECWFKEN